MNPTKRAAFESMMTRYTVAKTATQAIARQALIDEGIYTPDGKVAAAYGGGGRRKDTPKVKK